ncbi:MAG: hypothetical protein R3A80_05605 [Bdellovibrionota bacterium]
MKTRASGYKEAGFRSYGLELTGPRVPRSTVAVLDYYPKSRRLILSDLVAPGGDGENLDQALIDYFHSQSQDKGLLKRSRLATNAPLSLPPLLSKRLGSKQALYKDEVDWMNSTWSKLRPRPRRFLDYVHRPLEIYLRHLCPERFAFADAVGSNQVLLTARMFKLQENIKFNMIESSPRASFQRICRTLRARSFILKSYSSLADGLEARKDFMQLLQKRMPELFIFEESVESLILHLHSFHAFILALTLHLDHKGYCEKAPPDFPAKSQWTLIPRQQIDWDKIV